MSRHGPITTSSSSLCWFHTALFRRIRFYSGRESIDCSCSTTGIFSPLMRKNAVRLIRTFSLRFGAIRGAAPQGGPSIAGKNAITWLMRYPNCPSVTFYPIPSCEKLRSYTTRTGRRKTSRAAIATQRRDTWHPNLRVKAGRRGMSLSIGWISSSALRNRCTELMTAGLPCAIHAERRRTRFN